MAFQVGTDDGCWTSLQLVLSSQDIETAELAFEATVSAYGDDPFDDTDPTITVTEID